MGLHLTRASRLCDRLVAAGLLDRADDPANRRQLTLTLTPDGERVVRRSCASPGGDQATDGSAEPCPSSGAQTWPRYCRSSPPPAANPPTPTCGRWAGRPEPRANLIELDEEMICNAAHHRGHRCQRRHRPGERDRVRRPRRHRRAGRPRGEGTGRRRRARRAGRRHRARDRRRRRRPGAGVRRRRPGRGRARSDRRVGQRRVHLGVRARSTRSSPRSTGGSPRSATSATSTPPWPR